MPTLAPIIEVRNPNLDLKTVILMIIGFANVAQRQASDCNPSYNECTPYGD